MQELADTRRRNNATRTARDRPLNFLSECRFVQPIVIMKRRHQHRQYSTSKFQCAPPNCSFALLADFLFVSVPESCVILERSEESRSFFRDSALKSRHER